ncbi:MAG: hypothetical protein H6765_10415 [Candidatus Peribacteria bacterium]|nr:MAG: hypothetical protein H6765_10415 [Candidatus Peribacteria bacterium]
MQNIGQLINMASGYEETGLEGLTKFLDEISLLTSLEDLQTGEIDALRLMTVHASK